MKVFKMPTLPIKALVILFAAQVAFADNGTWLAREGVGTGGTNWADWHDAGNWVDGIIPGEVCEADLKAADNRYISITNPVSLVHAIGTSTSRPVLLSNVTNTFTMTDYTKNSEHLYLYMPFKVIGKSGENYGGPKNLQICGPAVSVSTGYNLWMEASSFRFDLYATKAGEVRSVKAWPTKIRSNAGSSFHFVAPHGSSEAIVANWSQTAGSPFLSRADGQGEHVLPVGTTVTGAGIPDGTFLKRVFPDGTIELSAAVTTTDATNALTFAAFNAKLTVTGDGVFNWNSTGSHTLYAEKYREEDELTVRMFTQTESWGTGNANAKYTFSTGEGFLPGAFVMTGSQLYQVYTLNDCHLVLSNNLAETHILVPQANKSPRITVGDGKSYKVKSVDQLVGTLVKDGDGTLSFAFPSDAKTKLTGTILIEEGSVAVLAAEGAVNYVANLTVKSGAKFIVPAGGFECANLTVESGGVIDASSGGEFVCATLTADQGAVLSGAGVFRFGNLSEELVEKLVLRDGACVPDLEPMPGPLEFEFLEGVGMPAGQDGDSILVFNSNALLRVRGSGKLSMLLVGGGGGGGSKQGGGGGGGGVIYTNITVSSGIYSLAVGLGGKGAPNKTTLNTSGGNSSLFGFLAFGGGAGGTYGGGNRNGVSCQLGAAGGSGGGGGVQYPYTSTAKLAGGAGVEGQGHDGANGLNTSYPGSSGLSVRYCSGGGGGGAGEPGEAPVANKNADNLPVSVSGACGGDGVLCEIWGSKYYGGGGGGGSADKALSTACLGGKGGGGNGARSYSDSAAGGKGTDGLGGGGGGGSGLNADGGGGPGGNGGRGVVIIRWTVAAKPEQQLPEDPIAEGGSVKRRHGYVIHSFTNDDAFVLSENALVDILLVGGGGGGGSRDGGGGGAGGVVVMSNVYLTSGVYPITVGLGGKGAVGPGGYPTNGGNTTLRIDGGLHDIIAYGGGGGGSSGAGQNGASSGGGGAPYVVWSTLTNQPGTCTAEGLQGHRGGVGVHKYTGNVNTDWSTAQGGGGGGAGVPGGDATTSAPGDGGDGVWADFSGKSVCYGGGGGGGSSVFLYGKKFIAKGGAGGGGTGGGLTTYPNCTAGGNGTDGLGGGGGGGGGASDGSGDGGKGGCGCVIIRYQCKMPGAMLLVR